MEDRYRSDLEKLRKDHQVQLGELEANHIIQKRQLEKDRQEIEDDKRKAIEDEKKK